jgi:hypothetical protein
MATVTPAAKPALNRAETSRTIRHPLQALKSYIRFYVSAEGSVFLVLFLSLWFWIGLLLDYGVFKAFAWDWVQELNYRFSSTTVTLFRVVVFGLLVSAGLALVATKVILRLMREFRDAALALVLERRFPKELGDRLITAVEMADPKLADKYGFSHTMIDKTIDDAAKRVEKLPVKEVFNWKRLVLQALIVLGTTVGLYVLIWFVCSLAGITSFGDHPGRFNQVAGVWVERNVLLRDTEWPRNTHLEFINFKESPDDPGSMRVPQEEPLRPDLWVRAVKWVYHTPAGWRALRWKDLPDLIDPSLTKIPQLDAWTGWKVDFDDLDPMILPGMVAAEWRGKTVGEVKALLAGAKNGPKTQAAKDLEEGGPSMVKTRLLNWYRGRTAGMPEEWQLQVLATALDGFKTPEAAKALAAAGVLEVEAVREQLFNWQSWTVDRIEAQLRNSQTRQALKAVYPDAEAKVNAVLSELASLADDPSMNRKLRMLDIPEKITVSVRGKKYSSDPTLTPQEKGGSKFLINLKDLKETSDLTVYGGDYSTRPRKIVLVSPPSVEKILLAKEEPAYIYYRIQGLMENDAEGRPQYKAADQSPLRGVRQRFENVAAGVGGDFTRLVVFSGTNIEMTATADRLIADQVLMRPPTKEERRGGFPVGNPLEGKSVRMRGDGRSFSTEFENVTTPVEFILEFTDADNIRGKRHILIEPVDDKPPEVEVDLGVKLRVGKKPEFQNKGKLVTAKADIPFFGRIRDEYHGINDARWSFDVTEEKSAVGARTYKVILGSFQFHSGGPMGPAFLHYLVRMGAESPTQEKSKGPRATPQLFSMKQRLTDRFADRYETPLAWLKQGYGNDPRRVILEGRKDQTARNEILEKLRDQRLKKPLLKELPLREDEVFSFKEHFPDIRDALDKEGQLRYQVALSVLATDNNVETGPGIGKSKLTFQFLIVSENDLLQEIGLEEAELREKLDITIHRLTSARTLLDDQLGEFSKPKFLPSVIAIRVDEVKRTVVEGGNSTREVLAKYTDILKEMQVNRLPKTVIDKVDGKICRPLDAVCQPDAGFAKGEELLVEMGQLLEEGRVNLPAARAKGTVARNHLTSLIEQLERVRDAIDEGINDKELLKEAIRLEEEQRRVTEQLQAWYAWLEEVTLNQALPEEKK